MSAKILLTEDEVNSRSELAFMLRSHGYKEIVETATGEEAVEQVRNNNVGLLLMDVKLPWMDGIEAAILIRNIKPALPIVMVTAFPEMCQGPSTGVLAGVLWFEKPIIGETASRLIAAIEDAGIRASSMRKPIYSAYGVLRRGLMLSFLVFIISISMLALGKNLAIAGLSFSITVLLVHLYEFWIDTGESILGVRELTAGILASIGVTIALLVAFILG